jgi:hypothetical protein
METLRSEFVSFMSESFKVEVVKYSQNLLLAKVNSLRAMLNELREGMAGEGKSTAGDKHDTSIAMAQIECERMERQLAEVFDQLAKVERLSRTASTLTIAEGTLFGTNMGVFFMSVPLGKQNVLNKEVVYLSVNSPLGGAFISKKQGDRIVFNQVSYTIQEIC